MGAVGNCIKGGGFFTDEKTTEGVAFRKFIETLKREIKPEFKDTRPWLLCDNHPCHKSRLSTELIESRFKILWQPPYSS